MKKVISFMQDTVIPLLVLLGISLAILLLPGWWMLLPLAVVFAIGY